ncbi:MAG: thiamine-phosphate kinase [Planctomycetota bacterium]
MKGVMSEQDLIEFISGSRPSAPSWLEIDIGDDSAVLNVHQAGGRLVAGTDMLIEGMHYPPGTDLSRAGHKAVARSMSDLAAMAAEPLCNLAAVSFPERTDVPEQKKLVRAIQQTAESLNAPLVGGDIGSGTSQTVVAVTSLGTAPQTGCVTRSGARPGDAICVTGGLGGSLASGRHLDFRPRVEEALTLVERFEIHAMIDISDGLSTDLLHICESSGVGALIRTDHLPIHPDLREELDERETPEKTLIMRAVNDGEDYELLFCLDPDAARMLDKEGIGNETVSVIGHITECPESRLQWKNGKTDILKPGGWEHLK